MEGWTRVVRGHSATNVNAMIGNGHVSEGAIDASRLAMEEGETGGGRLHELGRRCCAKGRL